MTGTEYADLLRDVVLLLRSDKEPVPQSMWRAAHQPYPKWIPLCSAARIAASTAEKTSALPSDLSAARMLRRIADALQSDSAPPSHVLAVVLSQTDLHLFPETDRLRAAFVRAWISRYKENVTEDYNGSAYGHSIS